MVFGLDRAPPVFNPKRTQLPFPRHSCESGNPVGSRGTARLPAHRLRPDVAPNGTLYIGVTSDLIKRLHDHREGVVPGFTSKHGATRLVWFEQHATMEQAILREKQIKKWLRVWKLELIERDNLGWRDRAQDLGFAPLEPTRSPLSRG